MSIATRFPAASGHWLNAERLRLYPWLLVVFYLFMLVLLFRPIHDGSEAEGTYTAQGMDFGAYWTASEFALKGEPVQAYSYPAITDAQRVINPLVQTANPFFYPPAFLLICLPLALLPYLVSYLVFIGTTFAAYASLLHRIAPPQTAWVLLLAFPGVFQNVVHGQNAFLTSSLMAAGLIWLPNRPVLAGIAFGLLSFKPHLGVLIPLALLCTRQWRTIATAAVTTALLYGTSLAVFGAGVFQAFIDCMPQVSKWVISNFIPLRKTPTFFSFSMLLGLSPAISYALQTAVAAITAGLVAMVWLRNQNHALRAAALMTGALLTTPYLHEYDLAWLAFPVAWVAADGIRNGWARGEREWLALVWLSPLGVGWLYDLIHLQIAPFVIFGFLLLIVRRALQPSACVATGSEIPAPCPR